MDKAGQGGTELAVSDTVGGIIGALLSTRWKGLCPSRVTLTDSPASLNRLLRAGRPAGSQACTMLSIFCSAAVRGQMPRQKHKGHYLQLFLIQPKVQAHSRGTQSPEGTQPLV